MKKSIVVLLVICVTAVFAGPIEKPLKAVIKTPTAVCVECKALIEQKLPTLDEGIVKVVVTPKTGVTTITYYGSRVNIQTIRVLISAIGFDADELQGEESVYKKLPICCKRKEDGGGVPIKKKPGTK